MRINKYVALATGLSRRTADRIIADSHVQVNNVVAEPGTAVNDGDIVTMSGKEIKLPEQTTTILLNKPIGHVVSRDGQGSKTIYDLLPHELQVLKSIGRLDKDTSGLLILTNDGTFANELTHPSHQKAKIYLVTLNKPLTPLHHQMICDIGITLDDGKSQLQLDRHGDDRRDWQITMHEGRNRQIRRTFASLGYEVLKLHRTTFGPYSLPPDLQSAMYQIVGDGGVSA